MPPAPEGQTPVTSPAHTAMEKRSTMWLVVALLGLLLAGTGIFSAYNIFFYCDPTKCDTSFPHPANTFPVNTVISTTTNKLQATTTSSFTIDLDISKGMQGGVLYEFDSLGDLNSIVSSPGHPDSHSILTLTPTDVSEIKKILAYYDLSSIKSDPPPGPDQGDTSLLISTNGSQYTYHFLSSTNPGNKLAQDLQSFFDSIRSRTSTDIAPCSPTDNCDEPPVPNTQPKTSGSQGQTTIPVYITVQNTSSSINPLDVSISIDGKVVVNKNFAYEPEEQNVVTINPQNDPNSIDVPLSLGTHHITITSQKGDANLDTDFHVTSSSDGFQTASIEYFYGSYPDSKYPQPKHFSFSISTN
ncbi:MAG TPA: hypothetical protein VMU13_01775 [Candidatus Paceibacterota bacterium]|nr:hypothetical protein [Candidatus Paceibacterota bacterium]